MEMSWDVELPVGGERETGRTGDELMESGDMGEGEGEDKGDNDSGDPGAKEEEEQEEKDGRDRETAPPNVGVCTTSRDTITFVELARC